jgi:UDP:flavonoid glycosyltransferase YjiC (YdhE family)
MKVLFVPLNEVLSHVIPLLALNRKLIGSNVETAFIMPRAGHRLFRQTGVNVLDIDHRGLRTEMVAYGRFSPDVVVDDLSLSTGYATALTGVPRVTIQRTGLFPGGKPPARPEGGLDRGKRIT